MGIYGGFLDPAVRAAQKGGEVLKRNLGKISEADVSSKDPFDFVTRVDQESEEAVIGAIRDSYPGHHFLAEETLKEEAGGYRWIIDPLDGTTNYIHGYPAFAVSVALEHEGEVVVGVVLDPLRDELFTAVKGEGAKLNGSPIRVAPFRGLDRSLIATGFPFRSKEMLDNYLSLFKRVFLKVSGIRRAGAAALDFAHLAAGRCDGFFELGLSPWDIAAGGLLITEAGGRVTDFGGGGDFLDSGNIVAGVPEVYLSIYEDVRAVFAGIIDR
ncbi:MAG: inositol monophosphatase [Thermodesulfovibrionales bacterium]|nr:inositol monophosphatase [Thermodesulfovibrionales bacterium]